MRLGRADLPAATREAASKIAVRYVNHHREQKVLSEKLIREAYATLRGAKG